MRGAYSIDSWVDPERDGHPDRSDFSDDLQTLRRVAGTLVTFDGRPCPGFILYERIDNKPGEMDNWRVVAP